MMYIFRNGFISLTIVLISCARLFPVSGQDQGRIPVVSKWDRTDSLAKALIRAPHFERILIKEVILSILIREEPGYPIVYVDADAIGQNDGSSWENACTDLQRGIRSLSDSGLEGWVWVAQGSYSSDENSYCSIHLTGRVMLFGGFSGVEKSLRERNPDLFPTIIRGNASKRYGKRAVDMEHETLIDGFIIRDSGYKNAGDGSWGGRFSDENQGGGIRTLSTFSIIRNNRITENYARGGGGIYVWNRDTLSPKSAHPYAPVIENNIIYHNYGKCGAGIQIRNSEVLFCNNIVTDNRHIPLTGELDHSKGMEIILDLELSDAPVVLNSVLWYNTGNGTFPDLYNHIRNAPDAQAVSAFNCIRRGGYGEGLVISDPFFTNPVSGDYSYLPESPCSDAGYPDSPPDPDGTRADIGVFQADRYRLSFDTGCPGVAMPGGWYYEGERAVIYSDSLFGDENEGTRYLFQSWQGEGIGSYSGQDRYTEIVIGGSVIQTLICQRQFSLVTVVMPVGSGFISQEPPGIWHNADSDVMLTAYAAADSFRCEGWSGIATGKYNPVAFRMDSAYFVTALFSRKICSPPEIAMNDTAILEDSRLELNLTDLIYDANDSIDNLEIKIESSIYSISLDRIGNRLFLEPAANWNGTEPVRLIVIDPCGLADSLTFTLIVLPVPDEPGPVFLVQPDDFLCIPASSDSILFSWHASFNADSGDTIRYSLMFGDDPVSMNLPQLQLLTWDTLIYVSAYLIQEWTYWQVKALDADFISLSETRRFSLQTEFETPQEVPSVFELYSNMPNPFNPSTWIVYAIPSDSRVSLAVYDLRGCCVSRLVDARQYAGSYRVEFDGGSLQSGVYFCILQADEGICVSKMVLIK